MENCFCSPFIKRGWSLQILEALVCDQLKEFLYTNAILSTYQSGFRKKHGTITAALKVVNDITVALDKSLFIDLSKAFNIVAIVAFNYVF